MKIKQVGAELFHVDTQSDMIKFTVPFCNFDSEPKNKKLCPNCYTTVCLLMLHIFPTTSGIHRINLVWQSRPERTKTPRLWYPGNVVPYGPVNVWRNLLPLSSGKKK